MRLSSLPAILALAITSVAAHATEFNFSADAVGFSTSGSFTATIDASGNYDITSIVGSVNENGGAAILIIGLAPTGNVSDAAGNLYSFDNVYYPDAAITPNNSFSIFFPSSTTPAFDNSGLGFVLATGEFINLWSNGTNPNDSGMDVYSNDANYNISAGAPNYGGLPLDSEAVVAVLPVSSTPEPSSLVLLGTGIMGLAGAARRRMKR